MSETPDRPELWNTPALVWWLADGQRPGARSLDAITTLRMSRWAANTPARTAPPLSERLAAHVVAKARAEILRRGGEVTIHGKGNRVTAVLELIDRDPGQGISLVKAAGWRYYSSRTPQRYVELAYLYGTDDSGPWAVRVPGTTVTVAAGLAWLTPKDVANAIAKGLKVRRQGDVYAIETTARRDGDGATDLPDGHQWRKSTRYLIHTPADGRKHRPLRLPHPVRFIAQRAYEMGRSGARGDAD
jgi:hypothetical protein